MSFDNNYPNRKDHRKPYRKSKAYDRSCRNHGSCPWCLGNRQYSNKKRQSMAEISPSATEISLTTFEYERKFKDLL